MAAAAICSDFGAQENKTCQCLHFSPFYLLWSDGTRCHDLSSLMLSFKAAFSDFSSPSSRGSVWTHSIIFFFFFHFLLLFLFVLLHAAPRPPAPATVPFSVLWLSPLFDLGAIHSIFILSAPKILTYSPDIISNPLTDSLRIVLCLTLMHTLPSMLLNLVFWFQPVWSVPNRSLILLSVFLPHSSLLHSISCPSFRNSSGETLLVTDAFSSHLSKTLLFQPHSWAAM